MTVLHDQFPRSLLRFLLAKMPTFLWAMSILCVFMWVWVITVSEVQEARTKKIVNVIQLLARENSNGSNESPDLGILQEIEGSRMGKLIRPVPVPAPPVALDELPATYRIAMEEIQAYADSHINETAYKDPKTLMIATTWRTGSTFFAEAMNAHPWIYYHYEPLTGLKDANKEVLKAQGIIESLSKCIYGRVPDYVATSKQNGLLAHNNKIKRACEFLGDKCFNTDFLQRACNVYPVQIMKLVRIRLKHLKELLDSSDEFHVIFLVRDPRAILASRLKLNWCKDDPLCGKVETLCSDLKSDINYYKFLKRRSRNQLHLVKYEDLAKDPRNTLQTLFKNLSIPWAKEMVTYLNEHTNADLDQPWTTHRISKLRVDNWRKSLTADTVGYVQELCDTYMHTLNYTAIDVSRCEEYC